MVLQQIEKPFNKSDIVAHSYPSLELFQGTQKLSTGLVICVKHNQMLKSTVMLKASGQSARACPRECAAELLNQVYILECAKLPQRSVKV